MTNGDKLLVKKILTIGAHPDDVEHGMGGTVAKHSSKGDDVHIILCTLGIGGECGDAKRREEEAQAAAHILGAKLHSLDYSVRKLNKPSIEFENIIRKAVDDLHPDRIYVHTPFDYHQIHAAVSECATRAAKDVKQLLFYECVSSTNPDFKPNAYVDITNYIDLKLKSVESHGTQSRRLYLQSNITRSLAYIRYSLGKLGSNPNGMAEAFAIHKFMIADNVNRFGGGLCGR
jgi:LmbE family N-acetylglucosaminyl deacetylase